MGGLFGGSKNASTKDRRTELGKAERLTCPFCGGEFAVKDLLFAIKTNETEVLTDSVYSQFLDQNFLPTGKDSKRRMKFIREWSEKDVQKWDAREIPLIVEGTFYAPTNEVSAENVAGDDDLGLDSSFLEGNSQISSAAPKADKGDKGVSAYRLCPLCHCELPEGIGTYREILIGLYGGKRSGKTTYMAIAATYMKERLNSLGLGTAMVMEESRDVLQNLYRDACSSNGNIPTAKGKPPFPIGMTIVPADERYEPFFLIFQDIPGEAAVAGDDELINHPFVRANAFLGVIDVNMFVLTSEREDLRHCDARIRALTNELTQKMSQKARETDEERIAQLEREQRELSAEQEELRRTRDRIELSICTRKYVDVFGEPKFAKHMKQLRSVQLMLTKMDRWMEASKEERKELDYCSELVRDHAADHKKGISDLHLRYADKQVRSLIDLFPEAHLTDPDGKTILEWLANLLEMKKGNTAFTGVSSKLNLNENIANSEFTYESSKNILDPIMNICRWENLLPVKQA